MRVVRQQIGTMRILIVALLLVLVAGSARAQSVPACHSGNFELGVFGGESYGLDRFRPMGGANVAYGLTCALFPFAEASYLPGVLRDQQVATGASTASSLQYSINMTDFHVGLHIRLPRPESRVVPYGVVGLGLIRGSEATARYTICSDFGTCGIQTSSVPSSVNFAVNFGGGLRFFFNERFAVRLEFKGFRPTSAPPPLEAKFFYRLAIGPVFQFR